jgi:hypothetical protein
MPSLQSRFLTVASVVIVLIYAGVVVAYTFSPVLWDYIEADVVAIAAYHDRGHAVYHAPNSVERYNIPYGPCLFLVVGASQRWLGPSITSSKLPGVVALLLGTGGLLVLLCRTLPASQAIRYLAWLAIIWHLGVAPCWVRAEPFLFLGVVAAIPMTLSPSLVSAVLFGALVGLGANFKAHAPLYFLPLLALRRWSPAAFVLMAATAAGVGLLPFVAVPEVSLSNYLVFLKTVSGHGLDPYWLAQVLFFLLMLVLPLLLADFSRGTALTATFRRLTSADPAFAAAAGVCLLILLIPASKQGAGPHHLYPLLPVLLLLTARVQAAFPLAEPPAGFLLLLVPLAVGLTVGTLTLAQKTPWYPFVPRYWTIAREGIEDIQEVVSGRGAEAVILMGAGDREHLLETQVRGELVFRGMPIGIDLASLMDYQLVGEAGVDLARLERELGNGKPLLWLVPRDNEPFSLRTYYPPEDALFPLAFRQAFQAGYRKTGSLRQFDTWEKQTPDESKR